MVAKTWLMYSVALVVAAQWLAGVEACGPGRGGGRRRMLRKYTPLVQRQYIPNMAENTLGASGRPEGAVKRKDQRFKELVQNWNPDIEFRDDEATGADRMMSQRLKEKLSTLAISVMNQWPNVKLRVIEGWDEDNKHSVNSLHYEGRAVDITTSDKDRTKYGMLARLAVEAGFDWVHYESRSHVHCSVKSEKADTIRNNGCFDATGLVDTPQGKMEMSQLQLNDRVLTMNSQTGKLQYSPVMIWLDRDELAEELYVELRTSSKRVIRLTPSHLVYLVDQPQSTDLTQAQQAPLEQQRSVTNNNNNNNNNTARNPQPQQLVLSADQQRAQPARVPETQTGSNYDNFYYYDIANATTKPANENQRIGRSVDNKNNSNNKLRSPPNQKSSMNEDDNATDVPSDYQPANSKDNLIINQESRKRPSSSSNNKQPKASSSIPWLQSYAPLEDHVFTTFARNALVGQYLLVDGRDDYDVQETGPPSLIPHDTQFNQVQEYHKLTTSLFAGGRARSGGDAAANKNTKASSASFDQIVSVNYVTKKGLYAPLTREGNIVVNSVVASCYAVISDHELAHLSLAPVRWISYIEELLFGLKPATRPESRILSAGSHQEQPTATQRHQSGSLDDTQTIVARSSTPTTTTTTSTTTTSTDTITSRHNRLSIFDSARDYAHQTNKGHIHWYPNMLYKIARFFIPTRYLF